ncbi:MAG: DUF4129 domain-containing protein [Pseudoxanthomonas sp.]
MRLDQLTVNLRARTPWEAMELGTALVRRHAAAVWKPWLLLTLPLFIIVNALAWVFDAFTLAALLLWWLKPVFERIPLYVLSRAVFGETPGVRETLAAQWRWGWKPMLHYLSWRRLGPARALLLPIDLLEGAGKGQQRERRRTLGGAVYGQASLLTLVCVHFEFVVAFGSVAAVLMFIPPENLPETFRSGGMEMLQDTPAWALLAWNFFCWLAMTLIEPFYVGAGLGMYLNRRTQIEAWDVEIAFRRLRERLRHAATPLLLALAVLFAPMALRAQERDMPRDAVPAHTRPADVAVEADEENEEKSGPPTLPQVFEKQYVDDRRFRDAVDRTYADPAFGSSHKVKQWQKRNPAEPQPPSPLPKWLSTVGKVFALVGEWGLWILVGILVLVLLVTAKRWLPWMRGRLRTRKPPPTQVQTETLQPPELLPPDIAAAARKLWREGKPRHALALLYRASVEGMAAHAQVALPPGATEAQCLRAARRLPDEDERNLFARMVQVWQYAAYAQHLPEENQFEDLLGQLQQRYGWAA